MLYRTFLGLTLLISCTSVLAQDAVDPDKDRQYVTDQLRLSLYAKADSGSQVIKLLQSGDLLAIEQIQGPYAFVTTPEGATGWVKRGFLVTNPTSNILLREERKKVADLTAEIEKLGNSKVVIDRYEKDMDKLVEQVDALESDKQKANQSVVELEQELEDKQQELDRKDEDSAPALLVLMDTFRKYWEILVPIILVIVLVSYLFSKAIIEARIKSKFHGIKIW